MWSSSKCLRARPRAGVPHVPTAWIAVAVLMAVFPLSPLPAAANGAAASVAGTMYGGGGTAIESDAQNTASARAGVNYTGVVDGAGIRFVVECDGQGVGAVASTSLLECYLETAGQRYDSQDRVNLPGNAVASARSERLGFAEVGDSVTSCAVVEVLPTVGQPIRAEKCVHEGMSIPEAGNIALAKPSVCNGDDGGAIVDGSASTGVVDRYDLTCDIDLRKPAMLGAALIVWGSHGSYIEGPGNACQKQDQRDYAYWTLSLSDGSGWESVASGTLGGSPFLQGPLVSPVQLGGVEAKLARLHVVGSDCNSRVGLSELSLFGVSAGL